MVMLMSKYSSYVNGSALMASTYSYVVFIVMLFLGHQVIFMYSILVLVGGICIITWFNSISSITMFSLVIILKLYIFGYIYGFVNSVKFTCYNMYVFFVYIVIVFSLCIFYLLLYIVIHMCMVV